VIDLVCNFSPWANSVIEAMKETKFGIKVAWGMRMMPELEYTHSAWRARDTTLNDKI